MKDEYPHRELSAAIIGAAMEVLNGLRPGFDEKIYENSLVLELIAQGHQVEQQRPFPVHYRGHLVGTLHSPMTTLSPATAGLGYLAISELELALLLNFKFAKLRWKRVVRSRSADEP